MSKSRIIIIITALLIAGLLLSACGGSPAPTTEPAAEQPQAEAPSQEEAITLIFWHGYNAHEIELFSEAVHKYWDPTHPNIKIELVGGKSLDQLMTVMSGGDAPDLAIVGTQQVSLMANVGALTDLTPYIEPVKDQMESELVAAGLAWSKHDGKYYAVPFSNYDWGVFYNKDLFIEAGLDPEKPPQTWDELKEYAQKLTKVDENGNITQLGWMPLNFTTDNALSFALSNGGQFYDPETGLPTLTDPKIVEAFEFDLELAEIYGLDKVAAFGSGFSSGDNPFQLGKAAMYIDGCWNPTFFRLYAPDLNFGVAAIPYSSPEFANATNIGSNPVVVPAGATHPDEAAEFAIWLSLSKELIREFAGQIDNLPQLKSELTTFSTDEDSQFFATLSNSENALAWAPVPYSSQYFDEVEIAMGKMYLEGMPAAEALAAAQKIVEAAAQETMSK